MQCPVCGGTSYVVVRPNTLRCTSEAIISAVPPGVGANLTGAPIPIRGECGETRSESDWQAASERARSRAEKAQREKEQQAEQERRARELEQRKVELLRLLKTQGNPGIEQRLVPGRYHLSVTARIFGRVGKDVLVEVSPAWPFGTCTWVSSGMRGVDNFENLRSGITTAGKIVPMIYAADDEAVEILYRKRHLWNGGHPYPPSSTNVSYVSTADIVRALERALR